MRRSLERDGLLGIQEGPKPQTANFRNVPKLAVGSNGIGAFIEGWYFEDGNDNQNNPGTKSQKYRSLLFTDTDYWE